MSIKTESELNVSLEPDLLETLRPLHPLLPDPLSAELAQYLSRSPTTIIPYPLLRGISQWSRTTDGESKLRSKAINPQIYNIVSLLAGTTTSPDRKFGTYIPNKEPEELAADKAREKKAITALINGVVSVFGVAFAAWWATTATGWKNEWKVLFALFVGIVVAVSEAGLYLIWSSRRTNKGPRRTLRFSGNHKKNDGDNAPAELRSEANVLEVSSQEKVAEQLRQRK